MDSTSLSSLYINQKYYLKGFLTAMRQEVTRAHKGWALDMVSLHNDVTKSTYDEIKAPPAVNDYACS